MENLDTKQKIYAVARNLFYEQGYYKTSLQSISKKLEISHSVIFHYFENKRDILVNIISDYHKTADGIVADLIKDMSILETQVFMLKFSMMPLIRDRKLFRLFYDSIQENVTVDIFSKSMTETMERIYRYSTLEYDETDKILLYNSFVGISKEFLTGLYKGSLPLTENTIDRYVIYFMKLFFNASEGEVLSVIIKTGKLMKIFKYENMSFSKLQDNVSNAITNKAGISYFDHFQSDFITNVIFDDQGNQNSPEFDSCNKIVVLTKQIKLSHYLDLDDISVKLQDFHNKSAELYDFVIKEIPTLQLLPVTHMKKSDAVHFQFKDFTDYNIDVLKTLEHMNIEYHVNSEKLTLVLFFAYIL
ncbi:MAG: TetR/AcrR family transcriptional regulator [Eubacteriaceae bacterium]|nr:TetR/AcrR family transcriptional regulator [Eubacteriaceae bacterium]